MQGEDMVTKQHLGSVLLDLLLPVRCAGCDAPGQLCCARCRTCFGGPLPVRRAPLAQGPPAYALAEYRGPARAMVLAYKEHHRRELATELGSALGKAVPWTPAAQPAADGTWWLVPVPSRAAQARKRGGQHMLAIARHCAKTLARKGQPVAVAPALALDHRANDSVGLTAQERTDNLTGRVLFRARAAPPPNAPVILLDDVITTGTTAAVCSAVLAKAGIVVSAVLALTSTG